MIFYQLCLIIATVSTLSLAFVSPVGRSKSSQHHHRYKIVTHENEETTMMQQYSFLTSIYIGTWLVLGSSCLTINPVNAATAEDYTSTPSSSLIVTIDNDGDGTSVSSYLRQVFGSPLVGSIPVTTAKPMPTDSSYDTREARNRAYDEAFQQDARERDAYYGQMVLRKRQETNQNVQQYRESLGLDGKGDVRMRVGEERVQGLASLRELKADYLSSTSSSAQEDDSAQQPTVETPSE